jgi:Zn-dependent protease
MHDPMKWALPLYRAFGIQVRVHLLFFLITIPMCLRLISESKGSIWWFDIFMITTGLVFFSVLLHEYGHSFSARWVGGDSSEILLWPLGGLAYVEVPHTPRHWAIVTACGPAVNVVLVFLCSIVLLGGGYSPVQALNPLRNPYTTPAYKLGDGRVHTSEYGARYYEPGNTEPVPRPQDVVAPERLERAVLPLWAVWAWRFCWINSGLFLFNVLIPAYPMDGGRLLHAYIWHRSDYRRATIICCYVGYGVAALLLAITILTNEFILGGLALFIGMSCYMQLRQEMETEQGAFGYDFSQGYTSLERDDPPPRAKRPGPIKRWMDARKAKKIQAEQAAVARDDERMDQLLDKIAKSGKQSLTDEERRFMERVSARYRNR